MALHELDHTIHEGMYDSVHSDRIFSFVSLRCARFSLTGLWIHLSSWISSTTIESRKFRIPSDLRRQPGYRPVSSKVGDHLRILLGVVVYSFLPTTGSEATAVND